MHALARPDGQTGRVLRFLIHLPFRQRNESRELYIPIGSRYSPFAGVAKLAKVSIDADRIHEPAQNR
jgi:hypothetical protein